jgi:hypothetical protein
MVIVGWFPARRNGTAPAGQITPILVLKPIGLKVFRPDGPKVY